MREVNEGGGGEKLEMIGRELSKCECGWSKGGGKKRKKKQKYGLRVPPIYMSVKCPENTVIRQVIELNLFFFCFFFSLILYLHNTPTPFSSHITLSMIYHTFCKVVCRMGIST